MYGLSGGWAGLKMDWAEDELSCEKAALRMVGTAENELG